MTPREALEALNPDEMTPREALEAVYRLKGLKVGEDDVSYAIFMGQIVCHMTAKRNQSMRVEGRAEAATPYVAASAPMRVQSSITGMFSEDGMVLFDRIVDRFGMSKGQLAETAGLSPETLRRTTRATAAKTQARMTEMLEIVARVTAWAGGEKQAMAWYRAEPIPAFGGRTAESLVKDGKATALRDYLDHLALGGFA